MIVTRFQEIKTFPLFSSKNGTPPIQMIKMKVILIPILKSNFLHALRNDEHTTFIFFLKKKILAPSMKYN